MSEQPIEKPQILVVDDSKVIRLAARKMLGEEYDVILAEDGQIAWEMLQTDQTISVVFTDLSMPNMNGMDFLKNIRNSNLEHITSLPVIIMTGHDDSETMKQAVFDAGATDFIAKPFESIDLLSRAKAFARLSRRVVELEQQTGYDKLTGLYNLTALQEQGAKAFSFASRHKLFLSIAYFEIKGFQECFLNHGKNVAQHIITAVGKRLQEVMREEDIAARIGVARYALVLPMTNRQSTEVVITRVRESINKLVFDTGKEKIRVNFSVGFACSDFVKTHDFNSLLDQAEDALTRALTSEGDQVIYFEDEIELPPEPVVSKQDIQQAITHILRGNFHLIPEQHLATVVEQLEPFMDYAVTHLGADSLASINDDIETKNVAM